MQPTPYSRRLPPPLTAEQQLAMDLLFYGVSFSMDGERIDPSSIVFPDADALAVVSGFGWCEESLKQAIDVRRIGPIRFYADPFWDDFVLSLDRGKGR